MGANGRKKISSPTYLNIAILITACSSDGTPPESQNNRWRFLLRRTSGIEQDIYYTAPQVLSATNSLFTPPRRSSPYLRILFMVAPNPLQQLHDLDRSSPQFHDQLSGLLRGRKFRNFVSNPQSEGLGQLVEYLDNVSLHITLVWVCTQR